MKILFSHFELLEDSRNIRGEKHKLTNILTLSITLCGYTDSVNVVDFLTLHDGYFINLLNLENGVLSHDTFSRVFFLISPREFIYILLNGLK